jgi:hypothetical protein
LAEVNCYSAETRKQERRNRFPSGIWLSNWLVASDPLLMIPKVALNIGFHAMANTPMMLMLIVEHGHRQSLCALSPPYYSRLHPNRRS